MLAERYDSRLSSATQSTCGTCKNSGKEEKLSDAIKLLDNFTEVRNISFRLRKVCEVCIQLNSLSESLFVYFSFEWGTQSRM
ncbi:hypothetical protein Pla144_09060 [Bythopirellula polymerisocia]|uniref:Uncharacterized protein n=1 Tax=Bythopirellula polymerisocia TaxID=2528003 RepID=A0A5C6CZU7_9BACT|nr:hypothetical protein Pla144_09060 [Bythopirellula polymerisocia]